VKVVPASASSASLDARKREFRFDALASPGVRRKGGADPLEALGTAGAARLVEAYSRIRDAMVRRAFVRLAEEVASRES